jgi:hypothetical protein
MLPDCFLTCQLVSQQDGFFVYLSADQIVSLFACLLASWPANLTATANLTGCKSQLPESRLTGWRGQIAGLEGIVGIEADSYRETGQVFDGK